MSNTYKMNQLEGELLKLTELAPRPVDLSFMVGYLAFGLGNQEVQNFRPALKQLISYLDESLITSHHLLQLLAVLKCRVLRDSPKSLVSAIQNYGTELICDNNYLHGRFFEKKPIKQNQKEGLGIECVICTVQIDTESLCYLTCSHMYHKICFNEYSKEQIAKKCIPLKCPTEDCGLQISNEQIHEFLSRDLREKYDEFTFQNYVQKHMDDTSWCPTPGCSAVFAFDQALDNYRCVACKKHYCLACKCEMHENMTCAEYQSLGDMNESDKRFMVLVKGAKYKQCPNCKFWVEKNEGCDHMTCRCKYEFCYVCGGQYGKCPCVGGHPVGIAVQRRSIRELVISSDEDDYQEGSFDIVESRFARPPIPVLPVLVPPEVRQRRSNSPPRIALPHPVPLISVPKPKPLPSFLRKIVHQHDNSDEDEAPLEIYNSSSSRSKQQQLEIQQALKLSLFEEKQEKPELQKIEKNPPIKWKFELEKKEVKAEEKQKERKSFKKEEREEYPRFQEVMEQINSKNERKLEIKPSKEIQIKPELKEQQKIEREQFSIPQPPNLQTQIKPIRFSRTDPTSIKFSYERYIKKNEK